MSPGTLPYTSARPIRKFPPDGNAVKGANNTYASFLLDDKTIKGADFQHCTFVNVSFKQSNIEGGRFLNCIFIACYFRRTRISDTHFTGCKFIECDFPRIVLNSCAFRYSKFVRCCLSFDEAEYSLPKEPNLREDLCANLAAEASALGRSQDARKYRIAKIEAREEHLLAAVRGSSDWYRTHYSGMRRLRAGVELLASYFNRHMWGYGEKLHVLLRNFAISIAGVFPVLFYLLRDEFAMTHGRTFGLQDAFLFSLDCIMPFSVNPDVVRVGAAAGIAAGFEVFAMAVMASLAAAYIFRWSIVR